MQITYSKVVLLPNLRLFIRKKFVFDKRPKRIQNNKNEKPFVSGVSLVAFEL